MPNHLLEKDLVVYAITPVTEVMSGDTLYQITLGEYVRATPEVVNRIGVAPPGGAKEVPATWMLFNVKRNGELPYKVGSKWRMTVSEDGSVSLAMAQ